MFDSIIFMMVGLYLICKGYEWLDLLSIIVGGAMFVFGIIEAMIWALKGR